MPLGTRTHHPSTSAKLAPGPRTSGQPRAVAQLGSALDWGSRGRRFKSCQPDKRRRGPDIIRPSSSFPGRVARTCEQVGPRSEGPHPRRSREWGSDGDKSTTCQAVPAPSTARRRERAGYVPQTHIRLDARSKCRRPRQLAMCGPLPLPRAPPSNKQLAFSIEVPPRRALSHPHELLRTSKKKVNNNHRDGHASIRGEYSVTKSR